MSWPWKWSRGKNPPKADLGQDLSMYWSEELKRWVEPGKEEECRKEAAATAAPPKNGPASMPASYTLERTSLQSRYVETPLFANPNGGRKETPAPAVRNLVPKADGKPLGANIFVPSTPVREAEDCHEGGVGGGLSNGISGELRDLHHDYNGDGEPDEAKNLLKSRRSLSAGDVPQVLQNEALGETNKSSSLASTNTIDGERANSVEDRPMQGSEITSCRDCEDLEGDGKIPLPASSNRNEEDEFQGQLPFPDAETAWNRGDALDLMEGYNMEGGSRYDKVNEGETEMPNNAMLVEESKNFSQTFSANQGTGEVAEDISKIFDGWTEEERQRWIDWLDQNYTREYWSKWSSDEWNQFWQWYQQANCGSYEQQDDHTGQISPTEISATDAWAASTAAAEGDISVQNFESSQVLSQLALSQGEDSRSQQGGSEKHQDSSTAFKPTENNSDNQQSVGSDQAVSGADEATGKGLGVSGQAELLDGSPNLTSPKNLPEGPSIDKDNTATDVIHTPLITTSCGMDVSGVDGQILKKKSKLTGPLPWDVSVDEDDDALDAGTEPGGLQRPSTATAGQSKQQPLIVTKADTATNGEAQPSLHSKHTGQDISLGGVGVGNVHSLGLAGEQNPVNTKDDKHQGLLEVNPVEKTDMHQGAAGIVKVSSRSADGLCILTEIESNDAESSVDKIQEVEKINGKIATRVLAQNGLTKGIELNGIDLGAMLLELEDLLQYVESSDEGVLRRKETTQKQLAGVIGALRLGEPGFDSSQARKDDSPASDSFEEPAEMKLTATHDTEVEKLVDELSCMQDDMDDMALALGLESRKVTVLRQHCKKQGIDADTILKGVEDSFGVPSNDASEHEDFEPTNTTDPVTFADSTSPGRQQILDSLGCAEDDVLLEPGSKQLLNMSSSGYPSWHVDGVV